MKQDNKYAVIKGMVQRAEQYDEQLSKDRQLALEYYDGKMLDLPHDEGRSSFVIRELRSGVKELLPSVYRTLLNSDELVEYLPASMEDDEHVKQSSDYVNYVIVPECKVKQVIQDAAFDAAITRNGIIKWYWDDKPKVTISKHSGLSEEAYHSLAGDDEVEVLEYDESYESAEIEGQPVEIPIISCKLRRTERTGRVCVEGVERETFLLHPDAKDIQNSPLVGQKTRETRSDLVAMGFDKKKVFNLSIATNGTEDSAEKYARENNYQHTDNESETEKALQEVDFYDLYIKIDIDGDGIAELRHMQFAGGIAEENLLYNEECDDIQYCDIKIMDRPHQFEGVSLADDLREIQRIKTAVMRQAVDNLYWTNNPQPTYQEGAVLNPDAVFNPEFGKPIRTGRGTSAQDAVNFLQVPYVADGAFGMIEYLDKEAEKRTGITDASAGLPPDALQNVTAKASAMLENKGIGQTDLIIKTIAEGVKDLFVGLLKLIVRHQDKPRTIRLRNEWVEFDPRHWNAGMDAVVNTGLGAGTRERDMNMLTLVQAQQEKLLAGFGPIDNPFVKGKHIAAVNAKLVEAAGLKTPGLYFHDPSEKEIQAAEDKARNRPDPEQLKMQHEIQLEEVKLKIEAKSKELEMQAARDKEKAQMDADLEVNKATLQADAIKEEQKLKFEREKLAQQERLAFAEIEYKREADLSRNRAEVQKAQASEIAAVLHQAEAAE